MNTIHIDGSRLDIAKQLLERFGTGMGTRLLDVGCGPGHFADVAFEHGYQVTALDARFDRLPLANHRITWVIAEIDQADVDRYDTVLALGIMYHLTAERQQRFLRRITRCQTIIIDTHFCDLHDAALVMTPDGHGKPYREANHISELTGRPLASFDCLDAFWPTCATLARWLDEAGFVEQYEVTPHHAEGRTFFIGRRTVDRLHLV